MPALYSQSLDGNIVIDNIVCITPTGFRQICEGDESLVPDVGFPESIRIENSRQTVDCDLSPIIGNKGLRFYDRTSKLILAAVIKCIKGNVAENTSLIVGSDGAIKSQLTVTREAIHSPKSMNPGNYANRGCNVIAGQISLKCQFHGESSVVSSGYRSGVDALIMGIRKVYLNNTDVFVAAGESNCEERTQKETHLIGTPHCLEGAISLHLARSISPDGLCVVGYHQQTDLMNVDAVLNTFCKEVGWDRGSDRYHEVIARDHKIQITSNLISVDSNYNYLGATALIAMAGLVSVIRESTPKENHRILLVHITNNKTISIVALEVGCAKR